MLNLISHTKGRTETEDLQEHSARRIWGPKREKAGKKLQDEEFYVLHSLPDLLGCSRENSTRKT
jgi:hypothetical protein